METPYSQIAIAGAGGFVGQALASELQRTHPTLRLVGLSRSPRQPGGGIAEWRACDLFSLLDAETGLAGCQAAYYLVHSMLPSAGLTQGEFYDLDLIAADNFARAARAVGLKQIVYLGGLIPPGEKISTHLASRLEVERALGAYGTPVTALRAGMVVGPGGSSFRILELLVRRLPVMLTPHWTNTPTQPIDLHDAGGLLRFCLGNESTFGQQYDIGGPDVLTYRKMIQTVAQLLHRNRPLINTLFFSPGLSRAWISLVTGTPRNLVKPLVQSLLHPMVARDRRLQERAAIPGRSFEQSARQALAEEAAAAQKKAKAKPKPRACHPSHETVVHDVRSVQRLPLPAGRDADWAAHEYLRWLPRTMPFILRVSVEEKVATFRLLGIPLLVLAFSASRSSPDRALFYVTGGWLVRLGGRARFEIRAIRNEPWLLSAVHEFRPRLPWWLYSITQARVHLWVMRAFGRHLRRLTRPSRRREATLEVNP